MSNNDELLELSIQNFIKSNDIKEKDLSFISNLHNYDTKEKFVNILKASFELPNLLIENVFENYFTENKLFNDFSIIVNDTCLILSNTDENCKIYFFLSNTLKVEIKPILLPYVEENIRPFSVYQQNVFDSYYKFKKTKKLKDFKQYIYVRFPNNKSLVEKLIYYLISKKNLKKDYEEMMLFYNKKIIRQEQELKNRDLKSEMFKMYVYTLEKEINHLKSLGLNVTTSFTK